MFDFLKDTVAEVPDMQNEEEPGTSGASVSQEAKKLTKKRYLFLMRGCYID